METLCVAYSQFALFDKYTLINPFMTNGRFHFYHLLALLVLGVSGIFRMFIPLEKYLQASSIDHDQAPRYVASDLFCRIKEFPLVFFRKSDYLIVRWLSLLSFLYYRSV